ncbi:MAG: hypothetical protein Q8903_14750, partial [Bacteroidota bacterium]|nr:hypothetical protein [Bacteroidota bacterium]
MSNKINTEEINTLIQAFALGCISTDELRRLHLIFQTENDIPWADLGMYQNMLSLLPAISNLEAPDEAVKNSLMEKIKRGSKFTTESEFSEHDYEEVKYIKDEKLKAPQHFAPPIQEDSQLKPIKVTKEDEVDNSIPFIGADNNEQQSKDNELVESYEGKKPWTSYIPIGLCVISLVFTAIIYVVLSRDISKMREDYQKLKSNVVTFDNMA